MAVKFIRRYKLTIGRAAISRRRPPCLVCGATSHPWTGVCAGCERDFARIENPCTGCGLPLPTADALCPACRIRPRSFDRCRVPFTYATPIDAFIRRMKFEGDLPVARLLGRLLGAFLQLQRPEADCLVPIPLHRNRLWARGYNQSLEMARAVAIALDLPVLPLACRRIRATRPQTTLDTNQRRSNVHGAFLATNEVVGRRVALIDDVVTSGHTAESAAAALKRAGAAAVELWACARAGVQRPP